MTEQISAAAIARFLQDNPGFFDEHAELFASLSVPHPHQARAISLGERQILILRDKLKTLEFQLATLGRQASFNESVSGKLSQWCTQMLAEPVASHIPGHIVTGLAQQFDLSEIVLRVWDLDLAPEGVAAPVDVAIREYATGLKRPYCGPASDSIVSAWFQKPTASMAAMALRHGKQQEPFGLLVLGSEDPERYEEDMATDFLQTISELSAAALSRLAMPSEAQ